MKFRKIFCGTTVFLVIFLATTGFAAPKVTPKSLKVIATLPNLITNLSKAPGDEISAIIATQGAIAYVGTIESSTVAPLTAPQIGGTDGFVAAIDSSGAPLWDLRLGTSQDDIATAVARDKLGNFWIVGASAKPASPAPAPVPEVGPVINVDGVKVDPTITQASVLSQLVVWKVAATGEIKGTYTYDTYGVILPEVITNSGSKFVITGSVGSDLGQQGFKVEFDGAGRFSKFVSNESAKPAASNVLSLKVGTGTIKSFVSNKPIAGVPSWKPKNPTPVAIKYAGSGALVSAYSLSGNVLAVTWQAGIGLVVLSEVGDGYGITIIAGLA